MSRKKVKIIAEIGVNHNGSISEAKYLIDAAKKAGCDFVKFQLWRKDRWPDIEYLRLTEEQYYAVCGYAKSKGIKCFATAFDSISINFLRRAFGQKLWKVPSGLNSNHDFLKLLSEQDGEFLISTGLQESMDIYNTHSFFPNNRTTVLHCVTQYPTDYDNVNLWAMCGMSNFGKYGLSCHTPGIETAVAAVALGASVIEKHITRSRISEGPDHSSSIMPNELNLMVEMIRNIELALGDGIKRVVKEEKIIQKLVRERMDGI